MLDKRENKIIVCSSLRVPSSRSAILPPRLVTVCLFQSLSLRSEFDPTLHTALHTAPGVLNSRMCKLTELQSHSGFGFVEVRAAQSIAGCYLEKQAQEREGCGKDHSGLSLHWIQLPPATGTWPDSSLPMVQAFRDVYC